MSEMKERMLAGELYLTDDPVLVAEKKRCALMVEQFNATSAADSDARAELLQRMLGHVGTETVIRPPLSLVYGTQTRIGQRTFINTGAVILDVGDVSIGDDVQFGPNVQLLTPTHPMDAATRTAGWEAQRPIAIGDRVWLAGGVIVCGGVTIGAESVVGAGSVVTRDVPPRVFAAGNPCRVIRSLAE